MKSVVHIIPFGLFYPFMCAKNEFCKCNVVITTLKIAIKELENLLEMFEVPFVSTYALILQEVEIYPRPLL